MAYSLIQLWPSCFRSSRTSDYSATAPLPRWPHLPQHNTLSQCATRLLTGGDDNGKQRIHMLWNLSTNRKMSISGSQSEAYPPFVIVSILDILALLPRRGHRTSLHPLTFLRISSLSLADIFIIFYISYTTQRPILIQSSRLPT